MAIVRTCDLCGTKDGLHWTLTLENGGGVLRQFHACKCCVPIPLKQSGLRGLLRKLARSFGAALMTLAILSCADSPSETGGSACVNRPVTITVDGAAELEHCRNLLDCCLDPLCGVIDTPQGQRCVCS